MRELIERRTAHSKTFDNGDGTFTLESGGHQHHLVGGAFVDSDFTWHDLTDRFATGECPFTIALNKVSRTVTLGFGAKSITIQPTTALRIPVVTYAGNCVTLVGLWRSVTVKVRITKRGVKFTYSKTGTGAPTNIYWQLGGDYAEFIGPVGYVGADGKWVAVPSMLSDAGLLAIDISGVVVGQEIDPTFAVVAGGDDWYRSDTNSINTTSAYANIGHATTTVHIMDAGCRFQSVSIPAGATVISAVLRLRAAFASSSAMSPITITFAAVDSAGTPPTTYTEHGTYFADQTSSASWTPGTWVQGTSYDTGSLLTPLQEVISRGGWANGNSVAVRLCGYAGATTAYRQFATYENVSYIEPQLIVTYTPPAAAGPALLQTVNGLAKASVATKNGLAIASIKAWNGVA